MRQRSETIGTLGRSPARQGRTQSIPPLPAAPVPPPPPERGAIRRWLRGAFFENVGLKFLSLVLALTVFLLVNDDKDREITVRVDVLYVMPADKVLVSERQDDVRVTLRGPWRRLRKFDEHELGRITLDLRSAPTGEIAFTPDMVHAPAGLTVASISPRSIRVAFDKRSEKLVEVTPTVAGHPQHGYVVVDVKATPTSVKVRGGEKLLAALSSVRTQELSVEGRTESFTVPGKLVPPDGIELASNEVVQVHVQVDEELVTRKLPNVTVAITGDGVDPTRWKIVPAQVEITLTGALLAVEKAKDTMTTSVKLSPGDRGPREVEVTVDGLPPGVGVRKSPERVKVAPAPPPER